MKDPQSVPQNKDGVRTRNPIGLSRKSNFHRKPNLIPETAETPKISTVSGDSNL